MQQTLRIGTSQGVIAGFFAVMRGIRRYQRQIEEYLFGLCLTDPMCFVLACIASVPIEPDNLRNVHARILQQYTDTRNFCLLPH